MKVCEVAPAAAGDQDFFAGFVGTLEDADASAAFCGLGGAEKASGACSQYQSVIVHLL